MKGLFLLSGLLATTVSAHMQMSKPYPIRSPLNKNATGKIDYSYTNSLLPSGQDYPCKGYQNDPFVSEANYTPGQSYEMELAGEATHGGGSCQLALTYDKGKTFKVIESMLGECPIPKKYEFTVPSDAPSGEALLAWTWFNKIGNREMYMNCAMVTIGGDSSRIMGNSVGMEKREDMDMPSMIPQEKKGAEAESDDDQSSTTQASSTKKNTSKTTDETTTTTTSKEKPTSTSTSEKATDKPKPKPTEKPKPTKEPKPTEKPKPTGKPKDDDNAVNNKQSTAFKDLPEIFVANVNQTGQCVTIEDQTVDFPEPGDNVMGKSDGKGYKCSGEAPFLGTDAPTSSGDGSGNGNDGSSKDKDDASKGKDDSKVSDSSSKDDSRVVSKQTMTKIAKVAQALSTAKSDPRMMGTEATTNNEFHNYVGHWYCYDGEFICSPDGLSWAQCANGYPVFMGPVARGTLCRLGRMVSAGDWAY